ncbi:energy transducer TonB [uncultured Photobacterium sp.]|uniref:energy transducer TonB n=1 Tax=uncultured Photobacterium sp. TaxID=173973 RepID=UPI00261631C5|nr:energy transducer TonB [uncultured Photobacterium sp.]
MSPLLPTKKVSIYIMGGILALVINAILVVIMNTLVWGTPPKTSSQEMQLSFRQFRTPEEQLQPEEPTELAHTAEQPAVSQLPMPEINLSVSKISPVQAIALPAMTATEFSLELSLTKVDLTLVTSNSTLRSNISSGLISATPVFQLPPQYPPRAKQMGIEGEVLLHLFIEENGKVSKVKVISEQPVGVFAQSATRAAYRWRFQPPAAGQSPWQQLKISYVLNK